MVCSAICTTGKGDTQRPTDQKKFAENYDRIFPRKRSSTPDRQDKT